MKQLMAVVCGVVIPLLHGRADAALAWRDGSMVTTNATCGASASTGAAYKVGYVVDPVVESPKVGQIYYVHAVAVNANCVGDGVTFGFNLPAGAQTAISAQTPVNCLLDGQPTSNCRQQFVPTINGGSFQLSLQFLNPGESYEIQVPITMAGAVDGAALVVRAADAWETKDVTVGMTVPFQPDVPSYTRGDDLVVLGSAGPDAGTFGVAFSKDDGNFAETNYPVGDFAAWARTPGVQRLSGDFNHDGLTDYALVGGAGWNTIPIAFSLGNGRFVVTNSPVGAFGGWASTPNVTALAGDFNRDGYTDIALVGGAGWSSIPVAFSLGNGTFNVTNIAVPWFGSWAATANVRPLVGDFNKDGMTDIALVGGAGWHTLPVAFSYGNGAFQITNEGVSNVFNGIVHTGFDFAVSAAEQGATVVAGDFNRDGYTDLAVLGGTSFTSIRVALSRGGGQFALYETFDPYVGTWGRMPGVKILTGDFNRDGATDIALTGVAGWQSIPVATATGNGLFAITNVQNPQFATWASQPGARAIVGDFNGDGYSDIALVGGAGWGSIPVGLGIGSGFFAVTNQAVKRFPAWASDTSAAVLTGKVNY